MRERDRPLHWIKHTVIAIIALPVSAGLVAFGLVASQWPEPANVSLQDSAQSTVSPDATGIRAFAARDGAVLTYRIWEQDDNGPVVLVLHGAGGHSQWMAGLSGPLAERMPGTVIAPDLRGHGRQPVRRGDVDYVGQLEDDLADLIADLGIGDRPLTLLGHSAGGGLAIRFAAGPYGHLLDRAVLIAPFLQHDAPTVLPPVQDGWAKPLVRRIAGLWMLNAVGFTGLNHLTVVQFNFPSDMLDAPDGSALTQDYSYRLQFSLSPRSNWRAEVAKLPAFLVVAGAEDRTFDADAFEPTMAPLNAAGRYAVLDGVGHSDIVNDARLIQLVSEFVAQ